MWPFKKQIKVDESNYWNVKLEIDKGFDANKQYFENDRVYEEFIKHESNYWIDYLCTLYEKVSRCKDLPEVQDFTRYIQDYDLYEKRVNKFLSNRYKLTLEQFTQYKDHEFRCGFIPRIRLAYSTIYTIYDIDSARYKDNMLKVLEEEFYRDLSKV